MRPSFIFGIVIILWVFTYTLSYGIYLLKIKERFSGFAVIALAIVTFVIPTLIILIRMDVIPFSLAFLIKK